MQYILLNLKIVESLNLQYCTYRHTKVECGSSFREVIPRHNNHLFKSSVEFLDTCLNFNLAPLTSLSRKITSASIIN